ncbi:sporulation integral membrane protein YtvI [Chengkuizengella axinellae]|uniref:Sporulation integral membrane protein YtvI n=1 Tax=Chengkuizengella axinellae TaxID=3064388 RepID=A0ABT9J0C0_9BACL|nr:sporulation integral membrane protein YtvI [Chengkuizengella sp. 2205SS18-9]MDP5275076.1 sporulation integral membrane protein YtvI [Chengkuizengella sp. 2205SS18-9]
MSLRTILIILTGLAFLYALFTIGFPFLLAVIIAIFLEPLNQMLMKYARFNRLTSAVITSTLFTLSLISVTYLLGMKVYSEFMQFINKASNFFKDGTFYNDLKYYFETEIITLIPPGFESQYTIWINRGIDALTSTLEKVIGQVSTIASKFPNVFFDFFIDYIVFSVAVYLFSFSLPIMKSSFLSIFEEKSRGNIDNILMNLRGSIFGFMRAQIILSSLTYIVALTGLLILGVDYALVIALLIIIVDLLPILGTGSFIMPWAIYNFIAGNIFVGVGLVILFLVITIFRRIVEPKILGKSIGIGALSALISLYVGFQLMGLVGLFLGPLVVILYQAMRDEGLIKINIKFD